MFLHKKMMVSVQLGPGMIRTSSLVGQPAAKNCHSYCTRVAYAEILLPDMALAC